MEFQVTEKQLAKLRQPIHISYIADYIFKKSISETKSIIQNLVYQGIIEESKYAKEYYVIKQNKNDNNLL